MVHLHFATGKFHDALSCVGLLDKPNQPRYNFVDAYLHVGQPAAAQAVADALVRADKEKETYLAPLQVEAAWQLSQWDKLENLTKKHEEFTVGDEGEWEMSLGNVLLAMKNENWAAMRGYIDRVKCNTADLMGTSSLEQGSYQMNYNYINKLCMVNEVVMIAEKFLMPSTRVISSSSSLGSSELFSELGCRLAYSKNSWNVVEPLLRLRRCCFSVARDRIQPYNTQLAQRLDYEIGDCWLKSARLAREMGQNQEAYGFLMHAKQFNHPEFFIESAKLTWERGNQTAAVNILKKGIDDNFQAIEQSAAEFTPNGKKRNNVVKAVAELSKEAREILVQSKLLLAKYYEESKSVSHETINLIFNQLKQYSKSDEEIFFRYAQSMDKQIQRLSPEQQIQHAELFHHTIVSYIKSIYHGPTYIQYCLPRMLTLWLDYTEMLVTMTKQKGKDMKTNAALNEACKTMNKFMATSSSWRKMIPSYYFLTSLPQLVSRLCHPQDESYQVLHSMLTELLSGKYYQQTFWHLVSVSKNRDTNRKNRCLKIFQDAANSSPQMGRFLSDARNFCQRIDELCDLKFSKGDKSGSLEEKLKGLPLLVNSLGKKRELGLILPNRKNLSATLPTADADVKNHQPFPSGMVFIEAVEDDFLIMQSLVQPKKITFIGSDGQRYSFLAKPKDDLRRDSRLMDCIAVINKLFRKDCQARNRNMYVRDYSVVPTNETSGMIEWVDNLKSIRGLILQNHKEINGLNMNTRYFQSFQPSDKAPLDEKQEKLLACIDAQGGPIFSEWFVKNFPDPRSWYMARMSFVRSTAVMSMIGYIIGLGDRHLENINVDTTTGDTFHVDMNCLFNKGEELNVPEVVPFRLTHNIVDAFGPIGIEGPFRIACEIALKLMRKEKDILMSMLRPFVCDPLVDWSKGNKTSGAEVGLKHLKRVEDRLSGIVENGVLEKEKRKKSLITHALSVEGQVDHIIKEATDISNLAVMYWGWAPYL